MNTSRSRIVRANMAVWTWANKPAASAVQSGTVIRVSDVGIAPGSRWVSDGSAWRPDGVIVLARSAVAVSGAADTNENTLATITLPAGALGTNGRVRVTTWWSVNNNANTKTPRIRWNGASGTAVAHFGLTSALSQRAQWEVANRNSASSQLLTPGSNSGGGGWGGTTVAFQTDTVNTANAVDILITGQKATAGDTITLEGYVAELLP